MDDLDVVTDEIEEICPICTHPNRAHIETQHFRGELTKQEIADIFKLSMQEVWEHFSKHMKGLSGNKLTTLDQKRDVLLDSMGKLKEFVEKVCSSGTVDRQTVNQLTELTREMRQTVATLQELEEGKKREQHITIEQYNDLRSQIVSFRPLMCPKCQAEFDNFVMKLAETEKEREQQKPTFVNAQYRVKST
jgi:hypothetical protein